MLVPSLTTQEDEFYDVEEYTEEEKAAMEEERQRLLREADWVENAENDIIITDEDLVDE